MRAPGIKNVKKRNGEVVLFRQTCRDKRQIFAILLSSLQGAFRAHSVKFGEKRCLASSLGMLLGWTKPSSTVQHCILITTQLSSPASKKVYHSSTHIPR
jgi:hypothetical protein